MPDGAILNIDAIFKPSNAILNDTIKLVSNASLEFLELAIAMEPGNKINTCSSTKPTTFIIPTVASASAVKVIRS